MKTTFEYLKSGKKSPINNFVLLSSSPRRKELLSFLNPKVQNANIDERAIEENFMSEFKDIDFLTKSAKICCEISMKKSNIPLEENTMYISADTIVVYEDKIYNKPKNLEEAKKMFRSYFGKTHHVVTSVCLRMMNFVEVFYTVAEVNFVDVYKQLENEIDKYIEKCKPLDKSGAYGIQELDSRFVKSICGDINTIIGIPVAEVSYRIFSV